MSRWVAAIAPLKQLFGTLVTLYLAAHGVPAPRGGARGLSLGLVTATRLWLTVRWLALRGAVARLR